MTSVERPPPQYRRSGAEKLQVSKLRRLLGVARGPAIIAYWPTAFLLTMFFARAHKFRVSMRLALSLMGQDTAVAAAIGTIIWLLLGRLRRRWHERMLPECLLGLGLFIPALWLSLLGLTVTRVLLVPVSAKLLLQTPSLIFIRTALNTDSVSNSLLRTALVAMSAPIAFSVGAAFLAKFTRKLQPPKRHPLAITMAGLFALAGPLFSFDAKYRDTNAAVTLVSSALGMVLTRTPPDPGLSPVQFRDEVLALEAAQSDDDTPSADLRFDGEPYDILIIVLETGVAGVMDLEREDGSWLPNLRRIASRSLYCRKHLTPFSSSTKSIFAMLTGRYPFPNFRNFIGTWPDSRFVSLPTIMNEAGYSTGCYTSIDGDFQRMDEFLTAHGMGEQGDRTSLKLPPLRDPTFGSDATMYDRYRDWLSRQEGKPTFFVLLLTNSHWPFFFKPEDSVFREASDLARYKNSLQHQDRLLGKHYEWLKTRGRLDRAIVVVVADHGAYFNLAGLKKTDAAQLYAHHVPALIDHPKLRAIGRKHAIDTVTSHVDLAPTLVDMCTRRHLPNGFQGLSLLRPLPRRRLVFFSQDITEGRLTATDGQLVARWNRSTDKMSTMEWSGSFGSSPSPSGNAPPEEIMKRVRLFYAYQLHHLHALAEQEKVER